MPMKTPMVPRHRHWRLCSRFANDDLRLYPPMNADDLKQTIANHYSLVKEQIFVSNGSDEVLAHAFNGLLKQSKPLLFPDISYSFYPVFCQLYGIEYEQIPLADDFFD